MLPCRDREDAVVGCHPRICRKPIRQRRPRLFAEIALDDFRGLTLLHCKLGNNLAIVADVADT